MRKILSSLLLVIFSLILAGSIEAAKSELYNGKARWKRLKGARYYIVYYKETGNKKFNHAVSYLSNQTDDYSIKKLKIGKTYEYRVSAIDKYGKEVWITDTQILPKIQ